jgi:hypothetical protein
MKKSIFVSLFFAAILFTSCTTETTKCVDCTKDSTMVSDSCSTDSTSVVVDSTVVDTTN